LFARGDVSLLAGTVTGQDRYTDGYAGSMTSTPLSSLVVIAAVDFATGLSVSHGCWEISGGYETIWLAFTGESAGVDGFFLRAALKR
jgi:hypothetical protein